MYLIVDFITKLPLVVYDRLLKMTYFLVTIEDILAEDLVRLFRDNM